MIGVWGDWGYGLIGLYDRCIGLMGICYWEKKKKGSMIYGKKKKASTKDDERR